MGYEADTLSRIMNQINTGNRSGQSLVFDNENKTLRMVSDGSDPGRDPDGPLGINNRDLGHWADVQSLGQVVLGAEFLLEAARSNSGSLHTNFKGKEDELVFSLLDDIPTGQGYPGTIAFTTGGKAAQLGCIGEDVDRVRVVVNSNCLPPEGATKVPPGACRSYIKVGGAWIEAAVHVVPLKDELFSRLGGLLETDVFAQKKLVIFGVGSGGAHTALELAKSGVMSITLVDHDRLEVCNVVRHVCGIKDVGRLKVHAMADAIRDKNPYAKVECWPLQLDWENFDQVVELVKGADLVIAATDNQPSRLVINKACVQQNKACIFAGAFRRAYGGQVLRVRPNESLCYQCFVMNLRDQSQDEEISSQDAADRLGYTDHPVAIEPGLSSDIASIGLMVVKLALQELLLGAKSTLRNLDHDLLASWYLWLNRREPGTPYEALEPLAYNADGLHVLRWYGIQAEKNPACPVCGDFTDRATGKKIEADMDRFKRIIPQLPTAG